MRFFRFCKMEKAYGIDLLFTIRPKSFPVTNAAVISVFTPPFTLYIIDNAKGVNRVSQKIDTAYRKCYITYTGKTQNIGGISIMERVGIITDSHSSITQKQAQELGVMVLPMPFYIDGTCYQEDVTLTREEFFRQLNAGADITTSQPPPAQVMEYWDRALKHYEQVLYIPVSSGLSGSCVTASAMALEEPYRNRVFVVDNGRVSALLHCTVLDALKLAEKGYTAPQIKRILERYRDKMVIYIGVDTLKHLKKGGRITPAAAAIGMALNIKPVLRFDVGTLEPFKKCRGFLKAKRAMLEAMRQDLTTRFRSWYEKGEIYLLAASSSTKEATEEWAREIRDFFPGRDVICDDLSLGVSAHIGYGGLGIGCSCKPAETL